MKPRWTRLPSHSFAKTLAIVVSAAVTLAAPSTSGAATAVNGAQRGSVVLSGSPGVPVANPSTNTVYVPIQCPSSFCSTPEPGHVLDVINAARCNASAVAGCRVLAEVNVGKGPLAAVVDRRTDTIYLPEGPGRVAVVNGAGCNAHVTTGCHRAWIATIKTGGFLVAAALDPKTNTLYAASPAGDVFAIDVSRCNAVTTSGCRRAVRKVTDHRGPDAVAVDVATDTVYAANVGASGNGNTVSVIDGATCNGRDGSGCHQTPRTIKVGANPFWLTVDQATNTVYVANFNDGTVSVIDGARCNATVGTGCKRAPRAVRSGAETGFVAVDDAQHTLFALNPGDDTFAAINTKRCNGSHPGACPIQAPAEQAGSNKDRGYVGFPTGLALMPRTGSAYLINVGGSDMLGVIDIRHCDAVNTTGCRATAPSVARPEFLAAIDPATDTIYASNDYRPQIDVLDGATCHAHNLSGCTPIAEIPSGHSGARVGAIDSATHTLYAADWSAGTLSVINTASCSAADTSGCDTRPATFPLAPSPGVPVLNPATHTLYTVIGAKGNHVAVIDAATCNAQTTVGCARPPGIAGVGQFTGQLAVSIKTNTIYAPNAGPNFSGDTVSVINGATCNGTDHSGCGHPAATVTVGRGPDGIGVDDRTHTVYVANNANGDAPGTVTLIDGATCNGSDTAGCRGRMPTVLVGRSPRLVAVDPTTDRVYVTNLSSASVSIIDGSTCHAGVTSGCSRPAPAQQVGSQPNGIAVNDATKTVYALTVGFPATSIFPAEGALTATPAGVRWRLRASATRTPGWRGASR
jgi:DNA-binding beta-propeller fold protein YncE